MVASAVTSDADWSPYVGSRPFTDGDSGVFYGREAEIAAVVGLCRRHQLTVLSGPSGAGLTSLVQAGVMPRAAAPAVDVLPVGRVAHGSPFPVAALGDHNSHTLALL